MLRIRPGENAGAGAIAGFITLRDNTHLFHLFVVREQQRKGIATALWRHACGEAVETGRFIVNASLNAVAVYENFGFRACAPPVRAHGVAYLPMRLERAAGQQAPSAPEARTFG